MPAANLKTYQRGLEALVKINERWIRAQTTNGRTAPALATAGIRYEPDLTGMWRIIPVVLQSGHGDAEDIVAWAAAEARAEGRKANVGVRTVNGHLTVVLIVDGRELTVEEILKGAMR